MEDIIVEMLNKLNSITDKEIEELARSINTEINILNKKRRGLYTETHFIKLYQKYVNNGKSLLIKNGELFVRTENELVPITNPTYGGTLVFLEDMLNGTEFSVTNGGWSGKVEIINGERFVRLSDTELVKPEPGKYFYIS